MILIPGSILSASSGLIPKNDASNLSIVLSLPFLAGRPWIPVHRRKRSYKFKKKCSELGYIRKLKNWRKIHHSYFCSDIHFFFIIFFSYSDWSSDPYIMAYSCWLGLESNLDFLCYISVLFRTCNLIESYSLITYVTIVHI